MFILFVFGTKWWWNNKMDSHFCYLLIYSFIAVLIFITSSPGWCIVVSRNYSYEKSTFTKLLMYIKRWQCYWQMVGHLSCHRIMWCNGWNILSCNGSRTATRKQNWSYCFSEDGISCILYTRSVTYPKDDPLLYIPS